MDNLIAIVSNTSDNCNSQRIQISWKFDTFIARKTKNDLNKDKKMIKIDSSNSHSDDEKEDCISEVHKALKEEIMKLHKKSMS